MIGNQVLFFQARLKLQWASAHIVQLRSLWSSFLQTEFCKVSVEFDSQTGHESLRVTSIGPMPAELLLTLGDAVHNMRCALDYIVGEILGWKDTRVTFPMADDESALLSTFRVEVEHVGGKAKGKGRNAALETAIPGIGEFITKEIRSFKGSNSPLWPLGKLDGRDKHRLLLPVLVPQTIDAIDALLPNGGRVVNGKLTVGPGGWASLVGTQMTGIKILKHGRPTAELFIDEKGIVDQQPLFPTLVSMSNAVSKTIESFETFVGDAGWKPPPLNAP
jgi:hypothetical protein